MAIAHTQEKKKKMLSLEARICSENTSLAFN